MGAWADAIPPLIRSAATASTTDCFIMAVSPVGSEGKRLLHTSGSFQLRLLLFFVVLRRPEQVLG
ncbi:MAG TPA: hypothetical protein VNC81_11225 [Xanthobacteraceae bacterium]|nr:hypothetical protein [Xanthobacteraceae bacterium]